jgi:ribosome-associated heat shock protein Hsp15
MALHCAPCFPIRFGRFELDTGTLTERGNEELMSRQPSTGDDKSQGQMQSETQRLDKWLWFARIVKSRTLAAGLVVDGKVRVNREPTQKPSQTVRPGDVVTLSVHRQVRVLKVLEPGTRRGPAKEAAMLYEDLSPARDQDGAGVMRPLGGHVKFEPGAGRPTKKDRRAIDKLRDDTGEGIG